MSADLRVMDYDQDIKIKNMSCSEVGVHFELACNISLDITLAVEDHLSASDNLYETATRPLNLEEDSCAIYFLDDSIKHSFGSERQSAVLMHVNCRNLRFSESSRTVVVLASENLMAISGWIKEAKNSEIPFHISVICPVDKLSAVRIAILEVVHSSGICVIISKDFDANLESLICSQEMSSRPMHPKLYISLEIGEKSGRCKKPPLKANTTKKTEENLQHWEESCAAIEMLGVAALQVASTLRFDFVLLQKNSYDVCEGQMTRTVQHVLSLRRAFSMVRCGWKVSCLVLNSHDISHWTSMLIDASPSDSLEEVLFHGSHGLNTRAQRHFGDRAALVTHTPAVQRRPDDSIWRARYGPRCGQPIDRSTHPRALHDEELYRTATGCVPEIDFLSPCGDAAKSIAALQRPHWRRRRPAPRPALSVQVLANNRPAVLFRTLQQLVEQTRPQCVTVHLDGDNLRRLTDAQWATLRVAQWFGRAFGVRWRRNGDSLHPSLARRLGFRRNYADALHASGGASSVDHLVHMTWNALAHAFEGRAPPDTCERNATLMLEDDLLPTHDLIAYMSHGLRVMERDPLVRVVSAWNDNGFNLRPGLQCAVQRGEYFMSLGWLTTRAVYEELTSAEDFWPIERFAMDGSDSGNLTEAVLRIGHGCVERRPAGEAPPSF